MKKLKLVISMLLALSVIFASSIVASAASMGVSLSASKTSLKPGDTVTITVNLSSNTGIGGVDFALKYNTTHLQYQSSAVTGVGSSFGWNQVNSGTSVVNGAFMNTDGTSTTSTGALATVTFKVITTSDVTSSVSVSAEGTDADGNPTASSSSSISLKIAAETTTKPAPTTTKPVTTTPTTTKPVTTTPVTTETTTEATTLPEESTTMIIATESIGVSVGNTYQLRIPSSMKGTVTFSSTNTSVVSVRDGGVVTTHAKGMATIKAVSENGVTKTWLLIVGDGSTVEEESSTDEDMSTEIEIIGEEGEVNTYPNGMIEEKTTAETEKEKENHNDEDKTFKIIVIAGGAAALIAIVIIVTSLVRKKKSFEG